MTIIINHIDGPFSAKNEITRLKFLKRTISKSANNDSTKQAKKGTKSPGTGKVLLRPEVSKRITKAPRNQNIGKINSNFELMIPVFHKSTGISRETLGEYAHMTTSVHNQFIKNLGVQFGTSHFKAIALYCTLLCEGRKPEQVSRVSLGRKDKWPKCFGFLRPVFHAIIDAKKEHTHNHKVELLRLLQSLFKLNKVCSDFAELDVENIKSTFLIPKEIEEGYIKYLDDRLGETKNIETNSFNIEPFSGSSRGPNNLPKKDSAGQEAAALYVSKHFVHFRTICQLTDNVPFFDYFEQTAKEFIEANPKFDLSKVKLRKLVAVPDKGNKSRTVAISDFWTQCLLGPLEKDLQRRLVKDFPNSTAYFSHSDGFNELVSKWSPDLVSIDAQSWTDNYPARLQYLTLRKLYGQQFAIAWQALAIKCPWYVGNSDHTVIYGKGQGMGTKASFMAATYCDHMMIEHTYMKEYQKVLFYKKVGDDLVVTDPKGVFAGMYSSIGVPVNHSKSKFASPNGHFMEFVSRSAWDGTDFSALSANLSAKTLKQPFMLATFAAHLKERFPLNLVPTLDELLLATRGRYKDQASFDSNRRRVLTLFKIYQDLSGEQIIDLGTEISYESYRHLLMSLILNAADLVHQPLVDESAIERASDLVSGFQNSETPCKWTYFLENRMSVYDIDFFQYATTLLGKLDGQREAGMKEGFIFETTPNIHPKRWLVLDADDFHIDQQMSKLILEINMEAKCKKEGVKILHNLHTLHSKNAQPMVELFKTLNKAMNEATSRSDWKLDMRQEYKLRTIGLLRVYKSLNEIDL